MLKILVVEDEPLLRELTRRQIEMLGFDVLTVGSGEEAVEKYQCSDSIGMIFMDIGLPGMDGEETTLQIRQRERTARRREVPVIALTAHSSRDRCIDSGINDFLQKPALLADLKKVISKWM